MSKLNVGTSYWDAGRTFYKSAAWHELSSACKARSNYTCQSCGHQAKTSFERGLMHAHHKISRPAVGYMTGLDTLENLETLCIDCHEKRHGRNLQKKKDAPPKLFRATRLRRM